MLAKMLASKPARYAAPSAEGLCEADIHDRRIQHIGYTLHDKLIGGQAAVHLEFFEPDAAVALHGRDHVFDLKQDRFERGAHDMIFVATKGQADNRGLGVHFQYAAPMPLNAGITCTP